MAEPIFTPGPARRRYTLLNEFEAPLSQVLDATLEEAFVRNPVPSIYRSSVLAEAKNEKSFRLKPEFQDESFIDQFLLSLDDENLQDRTVLTAEEARRRVEDARLPLEIPDEGITEEALNILIERKQNERRRQEVIARAPEGFFSTAAQLTVGLGASVLDPLNIASAFIPVVGQARYAQMLRSAATPLGRAGVRARVGALEGAVGAAAVEPIVYAAARYEQADYDLSDSLLNIAFGTVLGGGLHAGAGAIGDALGVTLPDGSVRVDAPDPETARQNARTPAGRTPSELAKQPVEVREQLLRSAVGQAADGRMVDVTVVGDFTPVVRVQEQVYVPAEGLRRISPDADEIFKQQNPALYEYWSSRTKRQEVLRRWIDELDAGPREEAIQRAVAPLDNEIEDLRARQVGKSKRLQKKFEAKIQELLAQKDKAVAEIRKTDTPDLAKVRADLQKVDVELRDRQVEINQARAQAQAEADKRTTYEFDEPGSYEFRYKYVEDVNANPAEVRRKVNETFGVERSVAADPEASIRIQRQIDDPDQDFDIETPEAAERLLQETREMINEDLANRGLDPLDTTEEDALIQQVDEFNNGLRAGFVCGIRKGE